MIHRGACSLLQVGQILNFKRLIIINIIITLRDYKSKMYKTRTIVVKYEIYI